MKSNIFPSVDIIVVNWNAGCQLLQCLKSLASTDQSRFSIANVIVVDNASSDGSLESLQELSLPIHIIRNADNRGFAAACNQGAAGSVSNYLLFLNPDTELYQDSLNYPIEFMANPKNSSVGIAGIQLLGDDGLPDHTCTRFPTVGLFLIKILGLDKIFPRLFPSYFMYEWDHSDNKVVDHVIGAFYLVRRELYELLGGFDERFFVYLEDLDFSLRAKKAGWCSYFIADVNAYHKGGGTSEQVKAKRMFYSLQSRILYAFKHFGTFSGYTVLLGTLFLEFVTRAIFAISKKSLAQLLETSSGYGLLWSNLPELMARRGGRFEHR